MRRLVLAMMVAAVVARAEPTLVVEAAPVNVLANTPPCCNCAPEGAAPPVKSAGLSNRNRSLHARHVCAEASAPA